MSVVWLIVFPIFVDFFSKNISHKSFTLQIVNIIDLILTEVKDIQSGCFEVS